MGWRLKTAGLDAAIIEIAVARHFGYRQNIIVPNVYWGLGLHYEADLVVLRPSGYAVEIEIKVSAADIKADLKKRWAHRSNLFRQLWFAVPQYLADNQNIPKTAGILGLTDLDTNRPTVKIIRPAKPNKSAIIWDAKKREKLLHLGLMRIWGLKENLNAVKRRYFAQLKNKS